MLVSRLLCVRDSQNNFRVTFHAVSVAEVNALYE